MAKNGKQIQKLLSVLERHFVMSSDTNKKRGGLLAIAAVSIGLGKDTEQFMKELVNPILNCLKDVDSKVRYAAIESLYNVVKVSRTAIIPIFPEVFTALSLLVPDQDAAVRNGSELLDRLLKVSTYSRRINNTKSKLKSPSFARTSCRNPHNFSTWTPLCHCSGNESTRNIRLENSLSSVGFRWVVKPDNLSSSIAVTIPSSDSQCGS